MKPSWMTYGVLKDLPRQDLLALLGDHGFLGVEFRTDAGHGHGVEASIGKSEREGVVVDCRQAGIEIVAVATGNRYHQPDPATLRGQIEETKARIDLGAPRVRVFGNNFPADADRDKTISQVAETLGELATYGNGKGVKPCLELHGEFDWKACKAVAEGVDHENLGRE